MKHFTPAHKGVKPKFTVDPAKQLKLRSMDQVYLLPDMEIYQPQAYSWEKYNGEHERVRDMHPYHIIQILRTLSSQGGKYSRCWYILDQALRRRNVAMTGRITIKSGKADMVEHGPNYEQVTRL